MPTLIKNKENHLAKVNKVYSGSRKSCKNLYRFYSACRQTILFCLSPDDFIHLEGRDRSDIDANYVGIIRKVSAMVAYSKLAVFFPEILKIYQNMH